MSGVKKIFERLDIYIPIVHFFQSDNMCTENMFAAGKKTGRNDGWRYLLYFYWVYTIIICTYTYC